MKRNRGAGITRRQFLKQAASASAAAVAFPYIVPASALGLDGTIAPSNRLSMGVIGVGGRGQYVMGAFMAQPDAHVVAVCDVIGERRENARKQVNQHYGNEDCQAYIDMREILDRKDIDAVLIATGDNWHSGVSVMAARAGKDIYCEKPMSVTIAESRAVSDTMRRLGRVFQCGTQRRSISHFRLAVDLARTGKLGRLTELHAEQSPGMLEFKYGYLPGQEEPAKDVVDWNMWLGPAPWRPYNPETYTRGYWSDHVDFSGASITEWGSHTVDLCQWANDADETSPVEYWKEGDTYCGRYENGAKLVIRSGLRFGTCPVKFVGEEGWVEVGDSGEIDAHPRSLLGNLGFEGGYPADNHVRAFLDNVKTRTEPVSNAEAAHRSITACHVANICKRLGRPVKWDPKTETCIDDDEANRLTSRAYREPWYL